MIGDIPNEAKGKSEQRRSLLHIKGHQMTVKQTLAAIRALGMVATHVDGEYRVTFYKVTMPSADRREAVAYYTDHGLDALMTAQAMQLHQERNPDHG